MCVWICSRVLWSGRPGEPWEWNNTYCSSCSLTSLQKRIHAQYKWKKHTCPTIWLFHFSFHRPFCWMRIVRIFHTIARITQMYMHNTLLNCMEQKEGNNECLKESWGCWWNSKMLGNGLWRKLMGSGSGKMI